ncbi:MAG: rhomboid family intramembrane serine protease [Chitinophagaceae bacterium]|nr:MAG: rhomboid family intramembrane serine protease [Chitinophagaceae bacterium]
MFHILFAVKETNKQLSWLNRLLFLIGKPVKIHESPLHNTPWLTNSMIALISVISIIAWMPDNMAFMFGNFAFYPQKDGFEWFTGLFSCAFLHGSWMHLIGNMYFFWLFGRHVECRFGRRRMLGLFFISTALGSWLHGMFSDMPLVGASGGIFGLLTFYAMLFPKSRILWIPFIGAVLRFFALQWAVLRKGMPVRVYVGIFLLFQLFLLYSQLFLDGNISALGHLGGGFAGVIIYFAWKKGVIP